MEAKRDAAKQRVLQLKARLAEKSKTKKTKNVKPAKAPNKESQKVKRRPLDKNKCPACQQIERVKLGLIKSTSASHWPSCPLGWKKKAAADDDESESD